MKHALFYIEDDENNIILIESLLKRRHRVIDELLATGATEALGKPFDIHQFLAMIDRYLP